MEAEATQHPTIYWAMVRKAPRPNKNTWVMQFKEFDSAMKRDQFVKNTKFQVTQVGER
jgi:hypothetical protein